MVKLLEKIRDALAQDYSWEEEFSNDPYGDEEEIGYIYRDDETDKVFRILVKELREDEY